MTYPPPAGDNPQQYQLQPEPQQPGDPYLQGYNSTPPPAQNYYQPQPGYPPQQPTQPPMMPQVGVQPGYPSAPGSLLPPPIPQPQQGGNLGVILGVVVVLVILLGVAAVLIVPGLVNDDDPTPASGGTSESPSEEEPKPEPSEEAAPSEEASEDSGDDDFATWGTPASSDDYDANTPEGAAIAWQVAYDEGDTATLESLMCADPTTDMENQLEFATDYGGSNYGYIVWGMSREVDGEVEAWAGWTLDDSAPESEDDMYLGYTYIAVEEDGEWKLCDYQY